MSNLGTQCRHSDFFEYLIHFWSYQARDYTVTKPRTWPTCWSSSDENRLSSHGDIHPAIQTFILLVTMEPASLLAHYSAIAADHNYTLLEGQPLFQLPDTSWYIPSLPAPPIPFVLGQCVLLLSLLSCIFCCLWMSRTKHIWYSEHGTYYRFKFILE